MIDSKHPDYIARESQWQRCRDTFEGDDKVKERGTIYLPKLKKQSEEDYKSYRQRADFFDAVSRTVQGLTGAVMRTDPVIEGDIENAGDITATGISLNSFITYALTERLLMGRLGILVDHNGERAYLAGYNTEQNINWLDDRVILSEKVVESATDDIYKQSQIQQYRELVLEDGRYLVNIWREKGKGWEVVDTIEPTKQGSRLDFIPYVSISVDGANFSPEKPPILGLANMNLSHYRTSADLEHGRHYTALPTPWVTGLNEGELYIGSQVAWILPEGSQAGYLEFTGQGLQALEKASEDKRGMMAALGAQLLQSHKNGVEAEGTQKLRHNAEASVLVTVVKDVEDGVNAALEMMAEWEGKAPATIKLNTDFSDIGISNDDLTALMQAWQSGGISHDTFLWNLQKGEVLPEGRTIEEEKDLVDMQLGNLDA